MCSYLHRAPHGIYYFRMGIPAELRPFMGGRREIKVSLGIKDRETAKAAIPDHTKAAIQLIERAKQALASKETPASKAISAKSPARLARERDEAEYLEWQFEQGSEAQFQLDMEIEELGPIMDAIGNGSLPEGSPAEA